MAQDCVLDPVVSSSTPISERDLLGQRAVAAMMEQEFVSASIHDIEEHLREAQGAQHPEAGWGAVEAAPPSLRAAVS
jgi:hypothetical protein